MSFQPVVTSTTSHGNRIYDVTFSGVPGSPGIGFNLVNWFGSYCSGLVCDYYGEIAQHLRLPAQIKDALSKVEILTSVNVALLQVDYTVSIQKKRLVSDNFHEREAELPLSIIEPERSASVPGSYGRSPRNSTRS